MSLPEQLQRQVSEAQSIIDKHYGTGAEPASAEAISTPEVQQTPETPAVEPARAEPVAEVVAAPVVKLAPPAEDPNSDTYRSRWLSLQGLYQRQTGELHDLRGRLQQMEQLLGTMQAATVAPSQAQTPAGDQFISDKDVQDFGADLVDMSRRAAKEENRALLDTVSQLRAEIASLRGVVPAVQNVQRQQAVSAEEKFFAELTRVLPGWEAINQQPDFHRWLLSPDPMTGIARQTYLEDAHRSADVRRAFAIFQQFSQLSGQPAGQSDGQNAPTQVPVSKKELEMQVAPGRVLSAPPPQQQQAKTWTPQEVTKFYGDVRRGVYKGREQERASIERDIFQAQREGRFMPNAA